MYSKMLMNSNWVIEQDMISVHYVLKHQSNIKNEELDVHGWC